MKRQELKFPLFVDIHDWKILLIGGGVIGSRRAEVLYRFGAELTVVCPEPSQEIQKLVSAKFDPGKGRVHLENREFHWDDLERESWKMVLTTTDDEDLNHRITTECRKRGIFVNNSSDQSDCDFFFPAVVEGQGMVMGLVSDGSDHKAVRRVAAEIRSQYGTDEE